MHEGISYLEDIDVYYYHCHSDESELSKIKDKWYKITCFLRIKNMPTHKNLYFVPQPRLEDFLKHNPEKLIDIEPISLEEVMDYIGKK